MSIIGKRIYMGLSDAVPKNLMQKIYLKLSYAGVAEDFNVFLGKRIFLTALIGLIAFISSLYIFSFLKFFYFPTEFSTEYFQIYVLNISNISFIFYST
ncbi:MAG: hypothetical protein JW703_04295, partial [Candidatus Diapherotrites archaeon]|nr:hypothetical protein [Candidatus Diapherotrites archaeon]